jgi:predicted ATP-grasp superfamily ATP-dependent carboligase
MESGNERESVVVPMGLESKGYACVRSPGRHGLWTIVASEYERVPAGSSRFCDETALVPDPDEDLLAYRDALLELAARPDVRTILPTRPQDTYLFSVYESSFEEYVSLVTPPREMLRTVHDRARLTAAAEAAGVPVPETELLSEAADSDPDSPRIVKSRYNLLASEYLDACEEGEMVVEKALTHLDPGDEMDRERLLREMGHEPIVQEYIPSSHEYLFGALYDHGEPLATFQHRQIRGDSYTGGGGVYRKSTDIPELERVGRRLLDSLDYHGLACIEYMKHAETGEFYLTEINPRLWQSVPLAVRAGADFPWYYYLLATGRADEIDPEYEVGFGTHQLYGEVGHFRSLFTDSSPLVERPSIPGTAWEILRSCIEEPRFDDFRPDDPLPFFRAVEHVARKSKAAVLGGDEPAEQEEVAAATETIDG